jgi:hypothetical protein
MYGQIYSVTCRITGKMYVGQTIQSIEKRFNGHLKQVGRSTTGVRYIRQNPDRLTKVALAAKLGVEWRVVYDAAKYRTWKEVE